MKQKQRCRWAGDDPLYIVYHDTEWGTPLHDDRKLFEFLILEGAQAGLSWLTILKKRNSYHQAFDGFDPQKVAAYGPAKIEQLFTDKGIIRNRLKILAAVENAGEFLRIRRDFGTFDSYIWRFVGGRPVQNHRETIDRIPSCTAVSTAMSHDLKCRGFKFVGPTICYAFMQAVGMVNDHTCDCFRYRELLPAISGETE